MGTENFIFNSLSRSNFYKHFKWSSYSVFPSLFLNHINALNLALLNDEHINISILVKKISDEIELQYLANDEYTVPDYFATLLSDITEYASLENHDITNKQLNQQIRKLQYTVSNASTIDQLKVIAVKNLSSILEHTKINEKINTEVESLALILDSLCSRCIPKTTNKERLTNIPAIVFKLDDIQWAIPCHNIKKIYTVTYQQCTNFADQTILFNGLSIDFLNSTLINEFKLNKRSTLAEVELDKNYVVYLGSTTPLINSITVKNSNGKYKRTAMTTDGKILWLYPLTKG